MEEQIPPTPPISPPPPPAVPATPVPSQSVARPKTFLFVILGLVLVGGALFAGIVLGQKGFLSGILPSRQPLPTPTTIAQPTPTPDPAANWQTYQSDEMNFSLKYPQGWFPHRAVRTYGGGFEAVFSFPVDNGSMQDLIDGQKAGFSINYLVLNEDTLEEHADKLMYQDVPHLTREVKKSYVTVAGKRAVVVDIREPELCNRIVLFENNVRYMAGLAVAKAEVPYCQEYVELFDQILATFKFLE
ncbi:MAG TPA: hypothetical protein VMW04_04705 [Patescibacteria group bacterium]|nr:hypothetical protein [Patescibacteria group bacterium]